MVQNDKAWSRPKGVPWQFPSPVLCRQSRHWTLSAILSLRNFSQFRKSSLIQLLEAWYFVPMVHKADFQYGILSTIPEFLVRSDPGGFRLFGTIDYRDYNIFFKFIISFDNVLNSFREIFKVSRKDWIPDSSFLVGSWFSVDFHYYGWLRVRGLVQLGVGLSVSLSRFRPFFSSYWHCLNGPGRESIKK